MTLIKETDYGTPESASEKLVTLEIDGQTVTVPEGTSIMRAAMELGVKVPKLCATDSLKAFGSCRLCLVEIEGRKGTPASCTTPVAPGIKVTTQTERLSKLRKGVMELYLSDHTPDARGEMLEMVEAVGVTHVRVTMDRPTPRSRRKTRATPISPSTPPSASSARAVSGPARKFRAPSH
jgi:formate dehydrogenase major subunit